MCGNVVSDVRVLRDPEVELDDIDVRQEPFPLAAHDEVIKRQAEVRSLHFLDGLQQNVIRSCVLEDLDDHLVGRKAVGNAADQHRIGEVDEGKALAYKGLKRLVEELLRNERCCGLLRADLGERIGKSLSEQQFIRNRLLLRIKDRLSCHK